MNWTFKNKTSLYVLAVAAIAFLSPRTSASTFNYTITASGTQTVTNYPPQSFAWHVTASATENWTTQQINYTSQSAQSSGNEGPNGVSFVVFALMDGTATLDYKLISSGPGIGGFADAEVYVYLNGKFLYNDCACTASETKALSKQFPVKTGDKIECELLTGQEGFSSFNVSTATATLTYPHDLATVPHNAVRTAAAAGGGSVSKSEGRKFITNFSASPQPQMGGSLGSISYSISNDNPNVVASVDGNAVFAQTSVQQLDSQPWTKTETASGVVLPSDGNKLIVTSQLSAPNADTVWSVTDDSNDVTTSMIGNQLWASTKPIPIAPGLQIEIASVRLKWLAENNQIYRVQWATALEDWTDLTVVIGTGTTMTIIEPVDGERRFYRLLNDGPKP